MPNDPGSRGKWSLALAAFVVGMVVMVGAAIAVKATDGAKFCGGCHAMNEEAWTHKQSAHAQFDCNECHTPNSIAAKLPYKARIGLHDIYVNSLSRIPDVVHTSDDMKSVIQANCRRCHISTTMNVAMDSKPFCTDCHRSVPHNKKLPIDRRKAADV